MPLTMYQASLPRFIATLRNLGAILDKARAHAEARKFDAKVLPGSRLFPDMLPLTSQVQIACDTAKGAAARLAALDNPVFEDDERTLDDLRRRVDRTIAFLEKVPAERIDGSEEREVVLRRRDQDVHFTGAQFLLAYAWPNFFFHVTTAYNILRHNGIEIGKRDYLGNG